MKLKRRRKLVKYADILDRPIRFNPFVFSRMFLLWAMLGLIGGIISGSYWVVLMKLTEFLSQYQGWLVIPVMAICGLLAGLIIYFIGDPGEMQLIVNNIRFNKGKLDPKNNPSMVLSSLLCVSSGGSLGPEAPLVQVTGSTGSWLGKIFRLKGEELRSMSIAGMASGFTALFGAPLGGSLFSLEILHHKHALEYYKAIIPALVASSFSYFIFALIVHLGLAPLWKFPIYEYSGLFDFAYALLFALAGSAMAWAFIYCTKFFKQVFQKLKSPIFIKTAIGGLLLGIIAYYLPLTRYFGHHEIDTLINSEFSLTLLFALLVFKLIAIA